MQKTCKTSRKDAKHAEHAEHAENMQKNESLQTEKKSGVCLDAKLVSRSPK